jgi:16S rRNA (cytosine967-C5)-methyltransferase
VEDGAFLDETINASFSRRNLTEAMKGLVYRIASGAVRHKGYFDWVLSRLVERDVKKDVRYLLWISLYQIAHMKKAHYHVVMEAVEYAKHLHGARTANFVNAVLRRFVREGDTLPLPENPGQRLSISQSFPGWLVNRWLSRFGYDETESLLALLNEPPQFTIRINLAGISKEEVIAELELRGIKTGEGKFLDSALHVDKLGPALKDRLFKEGLISVQDETSQLVARAVKPAPGDRVLDACAGVGTKTAQLRESFPGSVFVAMDRDMGRLAKMERKMNLVRGDGLKSPYRGDSFDIILLDAPCSSMGIIRKHPEIKWRRMGGDIAAFGDYQLDLMRSLWDNLKRGGSMVYSVCSFEPEETTGVLERFGKERDYRLENPLPGLIDGEYFMSLPQKTGMDGFFIARLRKP